jgi:biopolymer transport protein ExbD
MLEVVMAMTFDRSDDAPVSELNTTPLIDVMLVLLVMFIMTIPMQTHAVKIGLPSGPPTKVQPEPVINRLTIDASGAVRWNDSAVDLVTLRQYLDATRAMTPEPELHLQPAANARYERVAEVLAVVRKADVTKVGFVGNGGF